VRNSLPRGDLRPCAGSPNSDWFRAGLLIARHDNSIRPSVMRCIDGVIVVGPEKPLFTADSYSRQHYGLLFTCQVTKPWSSADSCSRTVVLRAEEPSNPSTGHRRDEHAARISDGTASIGVLGEVLPTAERLECRRAHLSWSDIRRQGRPGALPRRRSCPAAAGRRASRGRQRGRAARRGSRRPVSAVVVARASAAHLRLLAC
jgi:hypothetical protein